MLLKETKKKFLESEAEFSKNISLAPSEKFNPQAMFGLLKSKVKNLNSGFV